MLLNAFSSAPRRPSRRFFYKRSWATLALALPLALPPIPALRAAPLLPEALQGDDEVRRWAEGLPTAPPSSTLSARRAEQRAEQRRAADSADSADSAPLPRDWLDERGQGGGPDAAAAPRELSARRFELDEHTGAPAPPLSYEESFVPSVAPHGRGVVFQVIDDTGALRAAPGAALTPRALTLDVLPCHRGVPARRPSARHSLMLGDALWLEPGALDLGCVRERCARLDHECLMGAFRVSGWDGAPRSVVSAAPEQSLVAQGEAPRALRLLRDAAHTYYLTSVPRPGAEDLTPRWREVGVVHLLIAAARSYFTGPWDFARDAISARAGEPEAQLPPRLRAEARALFPDIGVTEGGRFEEQLGLLARWFRSFERGALPAPEGEEAGEGPQGGIEGAARLYRRVARAQRGVCRHRAYAFTLTARALGLPTRLVINSTHAFAEVRDPRGDWRRVDLGGEGPLERLTSASPWTALGAEGALRLPDGLPEPPGAAAAAAEDRQRQLNAFYERPPEEQSALRGEGGEEGAGAVEVRRVEGVTTLPPLSDQVAVDDAVRRYLSRLSADGAGEGAGA
ncbi:MAG: transglutaminase domain-containing protein, partial [Deltaproteobacteria bacterium]|nr:transglutaminase domain-containing protein [Deltaproteobacteria bacterium]